MPTKPPTYDALNDESFARVVGKRTRAPVGEPPPIETRAAHAQMAHYRTRAPKGVFRYATHEDANRDRERWTLDAMLAVSGTTDIPR